MHENTRRNFSIFRSLADRVHISKRSVVIDERLIFDERPTIFAMFYFSRTRLNLIRVHAVSCALKPALDWLRRGTVGWSNSRYRQMIEFSSTGTQPRDAFVVWSPTIRGNTDAHFAPRARESGIHHMKKKIEKWLDELTWNVSLSSNLI